MAKLNGKMTKPKKARYIGSSLVLLMHLCIHNKRICIGN